jgi:hypothetical protein
MMIHKRQVRLFAGLRHQVPQASQMVTAPLDRDPAGLFQLPIRIAVGQRHKAHQDPNPRNAPFLKHRFRPQMAPGTDKLGTPQMIRRSPFDPGDLFFMDMARIGAEASRLESAVNGDLLHPSIVYVNEPAVVSHPDPETRIFRRHGIIGLVHFHMAVPMDRTLTFPEERKIARRKRREHRTLLVEETTNLLTGRSVNPLIGNVFFPPGQIRILGRQIVERSGLQAVVLHVADLTLDLALVPGRIRTGRKDHRAVVFAKRRQLGIELRIVPVRMNHRRLEIVHHDRPGNTPERSKRIFKAT